LAALRGTIIFFLMASETAIGDLEQLRARVGELRRFL
jgi:hypothetical protein